MTSDKKKIIKTPEQWAEQLDSESYYVTREKGTERPFTGKYHDCEISGQYRCVCCGEVLFDSSSKFDAGCGWPSFFQGIEGRINYLSDHSHHMIRSEIQCQQCQSHLGHVFDDGPEPTGQRYCVNSLSLTFIAQ